MEEERGPEQNAISRFPNRRVAGESLANALHAYAGKNALVLGIPRGGVIVAAEVARRLQADFDAMVSRKLGVPNQPELAMGAVTAAGDLVVNEQTVQAHEVTPEQLARAIARGGAEASAGQARLRGDRPAPSLADRIVIVVDDGLATGATMRAALRAVRAARPSVLVAAVPVGDPEACSDLQAYADEVVCLTAPASFSAVSAHYDDFGAPDDETVQHLLQDFHNADHKMGPGDGLDQAPRRD